MSSLPDNAPSPRLCHIAQWPDFQGYGFNLHAEKSKPGQFIGKIDNDSPAEMAGLKEGDRIIEVNGVNIGNENHKQVVSRIKAVPKETKLLVVDSETDQYYKSKNIVVRGDQSNVIYGTSSRDTKPPPPEIATNGHHEEADTRSVSSHASSSAASEASTQPQSPMSTSPTPPPSLDTTSTKTPEPVSTPTPEPEPITTTTTKLNNATINESSKQPLANRNSFNASGLNLNMSASEMRAYLASRKKADPRKETMDLKKKYEIIQNM